jgi:hypothetical protein
VSSLVAYSAVWVREIVKRYNSLGVKGLKDLRHDNPGAELLSQAQEQDLREALNQEAEGLGLWRGSGSLD